MNNKKVFLKINKILSKVNLTKKKKKAQQTLYTVFLLCCFGFLPRQIIT
jgi:hypothetical protein